MNIEYLYNTAGEWIAFKIGKNLFNTDANWIGWFPWDDVTAVSTDGDYLGTIFLKNRLLVNLSEPSRGYPGYPGYAGYCGYIPGTEDVPVKMLQAKE